MQALDTIYEFLPCRTPDAWVDYALTQQDILLIDHAHCEKKAASTALSMIYRYPDHPELLLRMSKIAREELRHFEQVLKIMRHRNVAFCHLAPSRYAGGLHEVIRTTEPGRLVDSLIVGAFIEARSCERFAKIAPMLDETLQAFYLGLLASEARHYQVYLTLAEDVSEEEIGERVEVIREREEELILSRDEVFRFHSGVPG